MSTRSDLNKLKMRSRVSQVANQYLYNTLPRLSPAQVDTLRQNPQKMDELIQKLGVKTVQVIMENPGQKALKQAPTGLTPDIFGSPKDSSPQDAKI